MKSVIALIPVVLLLVIAWAGHGIVMGAAWVVRTAERSQRKLIEWSQPKFEHREF